MMFIVFILNIYTIVSVACILQQGKGRSALTKLHYHTYHTTLHHPIHIYFVHP
jgi:hypothetical protein